MESPDTLTPQSDLLVAGHEALDRAAWEEARRRFEQALDREESPQGLEGLATAAWWLDDARATFEARERAYGLYRERESARDAARIATWLAWDYIAFRGDRAVANGWLQRARRLLEGVEPCVEQVWLALREASFVLGDDAEATLRLSRQARELAESLGDLDLEMTARALEGLALVSLGSVQEGMRLLDEASAAAVGGEIGDRTQIGFACCYLIFACERVRDYDRAAQWCERLSEYCDRTGLRPLFSLCRAHYAGVLTWRGVWNEAEKELLRATADLRARRPAQWGDGLTRLAELRRQQGRLEEAGELLGRAEPHPFVPLGRALLELERGEAESALDHVQRFLRSLGGERRIERAPGLEARVGALVELGRADEAGETLGELREIVGVAGTEPLRAGERLASGLVARAAGDLAQARMCIEDAIALYLLSGAPFEAARARIELARVLVSLDRGDAAAREVKLAGDVLEELGATHQAKRAAAVRREIESLAGPARGRGGGLSSRELEVLCLVAGGLSNREIAVRLVVSEHTVHRHMANILAKLGVGSRTAAVARAADLGLL